MARMGMGCGIALGAAGLLTVIVIIAAAASSGNSSTPTINVPGDTTTDGDAVKDVTVSDCKISTNSFATTAKAKVTITNHTTQQQSYLVTIAINDQSGATRYGEATAVTNSLSAGQTTVLDATGLPTKPPGAFTCSIAKVTRLSV